ncbi:MAG: hypothetical protein ACFFD2_23165 [Promethearchaeota archaeon]
MVKYDKIVKKLQKAYSGVADVVVVNKSGKILFSTKNWNVKGDIKEVLANWWSGNAQFVVMNKIRFSVLQMEPERFIATNRKKKGHLIGASTPDGDKYVIAYIKPKAKGWYHMAYPAVARAAAMMKKGATLDSLEISSKLSQNQEAEGERVAVSSGGVSTSYVEPAKTYIDPTLKLEIEGLLQWMKNPGGLPAYISYSLQQNDHYKISKLAEIYQELVRICKY